MENRVIIQKSNPTRFHQFFAVVAATMTILLAGPLALACPAFVQSLQTKNLPSELRDLCTAVDRYQAALALLESKGVRPGARIADLHAPRMINPPTWLKEREARDFNPWYVYAPAPETWGSWEKGAAKIDAATLANFSTGSFPALSIQWLREIHATALDGVLSTAGQFRTGNEIGKALSGEEAPNEDEVKALRHLEYPAIFNPGQPLIGWHPTDCLENRSIEFQTQFKNERYFDTSAWPQAESAKYFSWKDGNERQCGYLRYSAPEEVQPQMTKWLDEINSSVTTWGTARPHGDPLQLASRAQRWFIAIHPYERGNGRMSRFAMEWILKSIGLPSPILRDMDEDIFSTEDIWAREIGEGILRSILVAEHCAINPARKGCRLVPIQPDNQSLPLTARP
jgi:fido (protein-threonine AMPylation protein)